MQSTFRWVATAASAVSFTLAALWLISPSLILWMWGIATPDAALMVARRGAALFLGFGVIFALIRNHEMSPTRRAVTLGFALACATLAALGIWEISAGRAGAGLWLAIITEIGFAIAALVVSVV